MLNNNFNERTYYQSTFTLHNRITATLHLACTEENIEHIQTLQALIAPQPNKIRDMHKEGLFTPLHLACHLDIPQCVAIVLSVLTPEMVANCDEKGKSPFFYAHSAEVFSLLAEKVNCSKNKILGEL